MSSGGSARERILGVAMGLFMEHGFADTTTLEIATRARVSKRELYALVGNKASILATCIAARGNRMRLPEGYPAPTDREGLRMAVQKYGATLMRELTDPGVIAVIRLGIAEAKRSPGIGRSIERMGREPSRAALEALLKSARAAGLLREGELNDMVSFVNGGLLGDRMMWILLGTQDAPTAKEIQRRAETVASAFVELYGSGR